MSRELDDAVTFEDEDGEANTLSAEFATSTMGHVLLGQGRADAAREVFRAVLAKDPADAEALRPVWDARTIALLRDAAGRCVVPGRLTEVASAEGAAPCTQRCASVMAGSVFHRPCFT